MEEVVWSLMETLARSAHDVIPLAPLKNHDEYTFVHSVNVSLLVLAQARSFGIQGQVLHALGLAALCHDVGKLSVPLDVLNRPGKLEGEDWKVMQSHAEVGAWQLAALDEAPPLSVVVAYEHHLRYDGSRPIPYCAGRGARRSLRSSPRWPTPSTRSRPCGPIRRRTRGRSRSTS
jgi:HD-GYP domain-containing protein (c-di-GMP phosphodiesterase class II)